MSASPKRSPISSLRQGWGSRQLHVMLDWVRRHRRAAILWAIGSIVGLVLGALAGWLHIELYLVALYILLWCIYLASGRISLSRTGAFLCAYAIIAVAGVMIYYDRPASRLAPNPDDVKFSIGIENPG